MGVAHCADVVVDENDEMNYNLILMTNDKNLGLLILFLFCCISNSFQLCLSLSVPPNGSGMLC